MKYLAIILLLFFTGCQSFEPPLPYIFQEIVNSPYNVKTNNCANKAGRYARALRKANIPAWVVIVQPDPNIGEFHTLVMTRKLIIDPTAGTWRANGVDWGILISVVSTEQLYSSSTWK